MCRKESEKEEMAMAIGVKKTKSRNSTVSAQFHIASSSLLVLGPDVLSENRNFLDFHRFCVKRQDTDICLSSVSFDNSRDKTLPLIKFLRRDVLTFSLNLFSNLFLFFYQQAEASFVTNSDIIDSSSAPADSVREEKLLLSPFLRVVIDTSPSPFPRLLHLSC